MTRLYLYGITHPREVPQRLRDQGVFLVEDDGRAAIVSELDEGPVEATRRNLLAHADVVEQLHEDGVVLPARFGYVLESRDEALELLGLPEVDELLERHEQTCELTLRGKYEESVLGEAVGEALADRRARDEAFVLGALRPLLLDLVPGNPAGEFAAFDLALLVERNAVKTVEAKLEELAARLSPPLHFKLVGPLPPYSFVRLALPAVA